MPLPLLVPTLLGALALADPPAAADAKPPEPVTVTPRDVATALETAFADAIARAEPSVVAIARFRSPTGETTAIRGQPHAPVPQPEPFELRANPEGARKHADVDALSFDYGSGVVVGRKGEILTCYHVIKGAENLSVRAAGRQQFWADVIAADPRSDLAVVVPRVEPGDEPPRLKPIRLGDATRLRKGSFLIALGNPYNAARDGTPTAAWGILANSSRRIDQPRLTVDEIPFGPRAALLGPKPQLRHYPTLLQLDAKLNLGMSGGAVVNLDGELVALTTGAADAPGYDAQAGYAIPLDALGRRAVQTLMNGQEVEYGFLGVGLEEGTNQVNQVRPNSPADEAALLQRDEIVAVGDVAVRDFDSLVLAVGSLPVGTPVKLRIRRPGQGVLEKKVVLAKFPVEGDPIIATNRPEPWRGLRVDYASALPEYAPMTRILGRNPHKSVAVVQVEPDSPAQAAGLRRGSLIFEVAGRPVGTPAEFNEAARRAGRGPVVLDTDQGRFTIQPNK